MATSIVKRRNFRAKVPDDFYMLKSLCRLNGGYPMANVKFPMPESHFLEYFTINEDHLYFTGYWSKWLLIRWYQKIKEHFWPVKYKVEYMSFDEYNNLKIK